MMYKKLSVLIPVYNEKDTIKACVESVLNADTYGMELELIISDNNSDDGLNIIACHVNPNTGDKIVVRRQKLKGKTKEIAEAISDKLLSSVNENIADGYRI